MRSMKELMADIGFNKDAPLEVQKAFIKHLINIAAQQEKIVQPPQTFVESSQVKKKSPNAPVQLEFDFTDEKRVS